ncbi:cysteine desulfurase NifS [Salipaludibacillus keqinensis]|uniref:cysteine desulfurase n=1 Tax=Salipaludibacillus keqinensis TaxID=2045207 RepID=A0A323TH15_9BACI|nr:cysteine desulfurase family protein [Salipaludibacillus keqinensis]PYZ94161.1 cysteine desulfurase NifS [Salipaludibacillus keqinensis]
MERIYLDHAATSPIHPEVLKSMQPYFETFFGNPSSIHHYGRESRRGLDEAREFIARAINASFDEIIFTSGGTEADNLAIIGYSKANQHKGKHLITTKVEHHGVLHAFEYLEKQGFTVSYLDVNDKGEVAVNDLLATLREETILVSVMFGNNEVGTIQPVAKIGQALKNHQAVFHSDAVQAVGMEDIDVKSQGIDLMAASSHKLNGPNGMGFLYARQGMTLSPLLYGGEQERKRRAGTENVPAIAGMRKALEITINERDQRKEQYRHYKQIILSVFNEEKIDYHVNGADENGLSHILNVSFPGINIESILMNLDLEGIAVSSGSACTAGSIDPSHVLTAMFDDVNRSHSAVRFSFGYGNDDEQVKKAATTTAKVIRRLARL